MKQIVVIFFSLNLLLLSQGNQVRKWEQIDLPEITLPWNGETIDIDDDTMLDIQFLASNPNYGWISGFNSIILRTTDAGETWIPSLVDRSRQIQTESVWFVNENIGYASGPVNQSYDFQRPGNQYQGGVYKSIDGGESWRDVTPLVRMVDFQGFPFIGAVNIWGLYFLDEDRGWALGGNCGQPAPTIDFAPANLLFFKTEDGGESWSVVTRNYADGNSKLSDLIMYESGTGYATSSGAIWETTDFGDSWEVISETGGFDWQEDISIFNNSIIVPYSITCSGSLDDAGGVRVSTDFGENWVDFDTGHDMYGALMQSDTRGFAVGRGNSLFQTVDGGQNWFLDNFCLENVFLDDLYFWDEETIWIVGDGVYKSFFDTVFDIDEEPDTLQACRGETVTLEIDGQYVRYEWLNQNNFNRTINVVVTGDEQIFTATYFDQRCPDSIFTKDYVVYPFPEPEVNVDFQPDLACQGGFYEIEVNSEVDFYWYNLDNSETFSENVSLTITEPVVLEIRYQSDFGCMLADIFDFEFAPLPEPSIVASNLTNFCIGDSVIIDLNTEYPGTIWKEEERGIVQQGEGKFIAKESGNYYVVAENEFGCIDSSNSIEVIVRLDTNQLDFAANYKGEFLKISDPELGERSCGYILLENFSWKPLVLDNPELVNNDDFSIPTAQLPIEIEPFGIDSIFVCFRSFESDVQTDSLVLHDLCFDHYIPIDGVVQNVDFQGQSRCNLDLIFESIGETNFYSAFFGAPFPNPANDFTFCQFVEFEPLGDELQINGVMLNQLGNEVLQATIRVSEERIQDEGILRRGELFFDTSNLANGAYQIVCSSPIGNETFTLTVRK